MPCNYPDISAKEYKAKLDEVTDLLCKAGRAYHNRKSFPKEVLDWWKEHRDYDKKRGESW